MDHLSQVTHHHQLGYMFAASECYVKHRCLEHLLLCTCPIVGD